MSSTPLTISGSGSLIDGNPSATGATTGVESSIGLGAEAGGAAPVDTVDVFDGGVPDPLSIVAVDDVGSAMLSDDPAVQPQIAAAATNPAAARFARARIVIDVHERTNGKVVSDIDWVGEDGNLLARLEGYESVVDSGLTKAFRRNRLDESAPTRA